MRTILFLLLFVCFFAVVCTYILCLLPCLVRRSFSDVLSCTPTGISEINDLTCECWGLLPSDVRLTYKGLRAPSVVVDCFLCSDILRS